MFFSLRLWTINFYSLYEDVSRTGSDISLKIYWHCSILVVSSFVRLELFQNYCSEYNFLQWLAKVILEGSVIGIDMMMILSLWLPCGWPTENTSFWRQQQIKDYLKQWLDNFLDFLFMYLAWISFIKEYSVLLVRQKDRHEQREEGS